MMYICFLVLFFIYLFIPFSPFHVCFVCFCFVAVDFVFIFYWPIFCYVLLSFSFCFLLLVFFSSLFILRAVFISLWVGLGLIFRWSESKISYFGIVYKFLIAGMELAVIKEFLFRIFNIYIYMYF